MEFPSPSHEIPRSKPLALTGTLLLSCPLFGAIATAIAMVNAFATLRVQGTADPAELATEITHALYSTLIGLAFGLVGVVLVSIALFKHHNREQWFYSSVSILSVIWCVLLFPLGLIPGLFLFFQFQQRKSEFFPQLYPKGTQGDSRS